LLFLLHQKLQTQSTQLNPQQRKLDLTIPIETRKGTNRAGMEEIERDQSDIERRERERERKREKGKGK
jgi:hypothetical protein